MNEISSTPESDSSEEITVQLVETEQAPPPVLLGTNPKNLYVLQPTDTIVDLDVEYTPWDLRVDETLLDGEGITPGIRYIPPAPTTYRAIILSRIPRPVLRYLPWLVSFDPDMRTVNLKVRHINITEEQYDQLVDRRHLDGDSNNVAESI